MILISVILIIQALTNLTDQVQIAVSLTFFSVLPSVLVATIVLAFCVHISWTATLAITLAGLLGQAPDGLEGITLATCHELVVPSLEGPATLMVHIDEQDGVIISSVQALATEL